MIKNTQKITMKSSEKIGFMSNFATMLSAGIPILEIVDSLLEDSKGNVKKILETLREDLTQGKKVHTSFAKFPRAFDKVTISILKASEEAGTLDTTLKDLRENIRKEAEFSDKIRAALLYPVFILGVFAMVMMFMLLFVMPKISDVFSRLKVNLPLPTRILIGMSDAITGNPLAVAGAGIALVALAVFIVKAKRDFFTEFFFSLPIISKIVKLIDLTRFTRSTHLLLSAGMPVTATLELTKDVVVRKKMVDVIEKSREMVLSGKTISQGLRMSEGYIPLLMIKLIEAGEKTGTLETSMSEISEYFDYEVSNALKTFAALIEPIMLVVVGVVVGGMMLAIITPIYGLIGQVGGR